MQVPGQHNGNAKRPGVAQFPQVHILLKKGLETLKSEMPNFEEEILAKGARNVNFLNESSWVRGKWNYVCCFMLSSLESNATIMGMCSCCHSL